ncbi:(dimethylallyl)adenosine tRNA methylthiotransferase [Segatella copri]|nr:(dimethylallyl)adenosine tRNA methylthiotransferase [Segatella copri]
MKDDLIQNHYANLVCGPDSYLNLPDMIAQCEMGTNAIKQSERFRKHHAWLQQLLPLLHRALYPWT